VERFVDGMSYDTIADHVEGIDLAQTNGEEEAFIIGGSEIYKLALPYLDRIYLTQVELETAGDTFAPELDMKDWKIVSETPNEPDAKNEHPFNFRVLQRKV
ncbi:MAG: dihydrofolate reductase, partial [Bacteroidota bacterium]